MSSPKLCPPGLCFVPHRSSRPGMAKSLFCLSPAARAWSSWQNPSLAAQSLPTPLLSNQ